MGENREILIVAHRGLHGATGGHAENSLAAMTAAWQAGISWCECDVQFSSDGHAVVIHDETVDRTTAGRGRVADMTLEQLAGLGVAPVERLIELILPGAGLMIEIKPRATREFLNLLGPAGPDLVVQTFHLDDIGMICSAGLVAGALLDDLARLDEAIASPARGINVDCPLLDRAVVDRIHRAGKIVGAWTVSDAAAMKRMRELGVDTLITDEPLLAMKTFRSI